MTDEDWLKNNFVLICDFEISKASVFQVKLSLLRVENVFFSVIIVYLFLPLYTLEKFELFIIIYIIYIIIYLLLLLLLFLGFLTFLLRCKFPCVSLGLVVYFFFM